MMVGGKVEGEGRKCDITFKLLLEAEACPPASLLLEAHLMSGMLIQRETEPKKPGTLASNVGDEILKAATSMCYKQTPTSLGKAGHEGKNGWISFWDGWIRVALRQLLTLFSTFCVLNFPFRAFMIFFSIILSVFRPYLDFYIFLKMLNYSLWENVCNIKF
jgi:hypothetical protein